MSKTNHFPIVPHCSVKPSIPSTTRGNTPMKKRIFTLIELLIVIAIIAILASMLLPALNKARSRAKNASCQARLKQVAAAAIGYTGDNGDFFPPVSNGIYGESNDPYWKYLFAGNTLAYLGINAPRHPENGKVDYFYGTYTLPTLQCPASTITYTFSGGTVTAIPSLTGYNPDLGGGAGILAGTNNPTPKKVYRSGGVRNSSVKVLISEYYAAGTFYNKVTSTMETAPRHIDLYTRHGGRLNYSFVDGHVEAYPWGGTGSSGGIQVQLLGIGNEDTKINFTRHWLPNR